MRWFLVLIGCSTLALAQSSPPPARPTTFAAIPIVITTSGVMPLPPQRDNLQTEPETVQETAPETVQETQAPQEPEAVTRSAETPAGDPALAPETPETPETETPETQTAEPEAPETEPEPVPEPVLPLDPDIQRPPARDEGVLEEIVIATTAPRPTNRPGAPRQQPLPTLASRETPSTSSSSSTSASASTGSSRTSTASASSSGAGGSCYRQLARMNVSFSRLADFRNARGCGLTGAVEVTAFDGVVLAPPGKLTCPAALATAKWLKEAVRPEAQRTLGTRLTKVEQWSTYSCRSRPSGRLSEHATGNAIDVARLLFADGRRLSIEPDWYARGATGRFLKAISRSSCRYFSVVLDPTSDAAHQNHLHLDMGRWRSCPYD